MQWTCLKLYFFIEFGNIFTAPLDSFDPADLLQFLLQVWVIFHFSYSGVPFCDSHLEHEWQNPENTYASNTFLFSLDLPVTTPLNELCHFFCQEPSIQISLSTTSFVSALGWTTFWTFCAAFFILSLALSAYTRWRMIILTMILACLWECQIFVTPRNLDLSHGMLQQFFCLYQMVFCHANHLFWGKLQMINKIHLSM